MTIDYAMPELNFQVWLRMYLPKAEFWAVAGQPESLLVELYAAEHAAYQRYLDRVERKRWMMSRANGLAASDRSTLGLR